MLQHMQSTPHTAHLTEDKRRPGPRRLPAQHQFWTSRAREDTLQVYTNFWGCRVGCADLLTTLRATTKPYMSESTNTDAGAATTGHASPPLPGGTAPVEEGVSDRHGVSGAADMPATPVIQAMSSTSSDAEVSDTDTASLSAPVETASITREDDDLGFALTPEDFAEAGRAFAVDDSTAGFLSPGIAAAAGVEVGGGDGEAGNTVPLSPSTPGAFGNLSALPSMDPLAVLVGTTAAIESTISPGPPTNGLPGSDPATDTVVLPLTTGVSTIAASYAGDGQQGSSVEALPAGQEGPGTSADGAIVGKSTLSATARPFMPSTSPGPQTGGFAGSDPTIDTVVLPLTTDASAVAASCVGEGQQERSVKVDVAEVMAFTLPPGQDQAETRANGAVVGTSTLSATARPFTPLTSYTPEAASAAIDGWKKTIPAVLAQTKVRTYAAALAAEEATVYSTPGERRKARHNAAAAMVEAAAPTRPRGENQWSEVDALAEAVSLWRLSDTPSPAHSDKQAAAQAYIANTLTAAERIHRVDFVDHGLHVAMFTLKIDDEIDNEDVRRGREAIHCSTQERLAKALAMGATDSLPAKTVPTLTKVDNAFAAWFGQLTLEEPAAPHEEEARFLQRVTTQTSVGEAISAMAVDQRIHLEEEKKRVEEENKRIEEENKRIEEENKRVEEEKRKVAAAEEKKRIEEEKKRIEEEKRNVAAAEAAAREEKMLALEAQQREAVWDAWAATQAARQAEARRAEEEARAAAAREQQRIIFEALEAQRRQGIADAEVNRQIQQAALEKEAAVRACLADVKRRRAIRIRDAAPARVTEERKERKERRKAPFPWSRNLRNTWRQGQLA